MAVHPASGSGCGSGWGGGVEVGGAGTGACTAAPTTGGFCGGGAGARRPQSTARRRSTGRSSMPPEVPEARDRDAAAKLRERPRQRTAGSGQRGPCFASRAADGAALRARAGPRAHHGGRGPAARAHDQPRGAACRGRAHQVGLDRVHPRLGPAAPGPRVPRRAQGDQPLHGRPRGRDPQRGGLALARPRLLRRRAEHGHGGERGGGQQAHAREHEC